MTEENDGNSKPLDVSFEHEQETDRSGKILRKSGKTTFATEDIIATAFAIGAALVAVIIALAMVFGAVPINNLTVGLAGLSALGTALSTIVRVRRT